MPDFRDQPEGWDQYKRLVLAQLDDLKDEVVSVRREVQTFRDTELSKIRVEIALLKFKTSMWGGVVGGVVGLLVTLASSLLKLVH